MKRLIILSLLFCMSAVGMAQLPKGQIVKKGGGVTSESVVKPAKKNVRYTTVSGEVRHHSGRRVTQEGVQTNHPQRYNATTSEPTRYNVGGAVVDVQQGNAETPQKDKTTPNGGLILLYTLLLAGVIVGGEVLLIGLL